MLSSNHAIVINLKKDSKNTSSTVIYSTSSSTSDSGGGGTDKCIDLYQDLTSPQCTLITSTSPSPQTHYNLFSNNNNNNNNNNVINKQIGSIAFKQFTSTETTLSLDYQLNIIQLMGLKMPPVRRKGYSGDSNYFVRGNLQSTGSLPNLHQHVSIQSSSSNTSAPSSTSHYRNHNHRYVNLLISNANVRGCPYIT